MTNDVILLIEDNQDDADLTLRAFKEVPISNPIVVCRDGKEALDYLFGTSAYEGRDVWDKPAVILLDLNMPRVNGFDVLRMVRSHEVTQLIPVVVLTSSKEEQDLIEAYVSGTNSYIRKPVNFTEFVKAVKQLGLYWTVLNEVPGRG